MELSNSMTVRGCCGALCEKLRKRGQTMLRSRTKTLQGGNVKHMEAGQLKIAINVSQTAQDQFQLVLQIDEGRRVRTRNHSSSCNPFVQAFIQPDLLQVTPRETRTIFSSECPIVNEKLYFELVPEDFRKRLVIVVWHRNAGQQINEFIGSMSFGIGHLMKSKKKNASNWYYLLAEKIGCNKHVLVTSDQHVTNSCIESAHNVQSSGNATTYYNDLIKVAMTKASNGFGFSLRKGTWPMQVGRVQKGGVAERAGLNSGDRVFSVNGQQLTGLMTAEEVARIVKRSSKQVEMDIYRLPPIHCHPKGEDGRIHITRRVSRHADATNSDSDSVTENEENIPPRLNIVMTESQILPHLADNNRFLYRNYDIETGGVARKRTFSTSEVSVFRPVSSKKSRPEGRRTPLTTRRDARINAHVGAYLSLTCSLPEENVYEEIGDIGKQTVASPRLKSSTSDYHRDSSEGLAASAVGGAAKWEPGMSPIGSASSALRSVHNSVEDLNETRLLHPSYEETFLCDRKFVDFSTASSGDSSVSGSGHSKPGRKGSCCPYSDRDSLSLRARRDSLAEELSSSDASSQSELKQDLIGSSHAFDNRRVVALDNLLRYEGDFLRDMELGAERYSRPLRNRIISRQQHNSLFQNIEKIVKLADIRVQLLTAKLTGSLAPVGDTADRLRTTVETIQKDDSIGIVYASNVAMLVDTHRTYFNGLSNARDLLYYLKSQYTFREFLQGDNNNNNNEEGCITIDEFIERPLRHYCGLLWKLQSLCDMTSPGYRDYNTLHSVVEELSKLEMIDIRRHESHSSRQEVDTWRYVNRNRGLSSSPR